MCGIAGLVYRDWDSELARQAVRRMIALQRHRGPDGEGFYDTVGASLGHARLAIIDLSEAGEQPMPDPERRYWLVFNGEIYNYIELADELSRLGHIFQGHSDSEVLLHAYCQWGQECVQRLRGMFAFAIWDDVERTLFAARDRLGIKPFHYWTDGNRFAFASEIKALLEFIPERRVHLDLARQYLAWNLLEHDPAQTFLMEIQRLPAAHTLTWQAEHGLRIHSYWQLQVGDQLHTPPERYPALFAEFRQRFEECITLHLRSDVPVGTSLSGGLDSSAVVCVINDMVRRRGDWRTGWQHTFSACFDDPSLDERPYINAVVDATGVEPHLVFPTGDGLSVDMEDWIWHQEEPVGGTNVYAQYCVARLAHQQGIKVLLDGQGADEQLAGYRKFIFVYLRQLIQAKRYWQASREAAAFLLSPDILRTSRMLDGRRYFFNSAGKADVLWTGRPLPDKPTGMGITSSLGQRIKADLLTFSLPVLLRYEDRNTMAFGIEARVPFVDHVLVEWLASLAADLRLQGGWTKYVMRQGIGDLLPEKVRQRKTKLGFSAPEARWLSDPLKPWLMDVLHTPHYLGQIVDSRGVEQLRKQFEKGNYSSALLNILFRLAYYESWARRFL